MMLTISPFAYPKFACRYVNKVSDSHFLSYLISAMWCLACTTTIALHHSPLGSEFPRFSYQLSILGYFVICCFSAPRS